SLALCHSLGCTTGPIDRAKRLGQMTGMLNMTLIPTLDEFLAAPIEAVRTVAPETVILGVGGTRRRAILAGLSTTSDEYAQWTREQMLACLSYCSVVAFNISLPHR